MLDAEGIDAAVLYTTVGLLWEAELDDPELSQAYTTRLQPLDLRVLRGHAAAGADRAPVADRSGGRGRGARARRRRGRQGRATSRRSPTTAGRSAIPTTTRCSPPPRTSTCRSRSIRRSSRSGRRARAWASWENVKQLRLLASVQASDGVRHQFTTLFDYGVFDRFPRLKVLVLESGGGWIGYWLDRIDAVYGHTFIGNACRSSTSRATTSASASGSAAIPTSARSRRWPSASAPSGSCGRRTSRTPTTRRSTSTTSTSSPRAFPERDRAEFPRRQRPPPVRPPGRPSLIEAPPEGHDRADRTATVMSSHGTVQAPHGGSG